MKFRTVPARYGGVILQYSTEKDPTWRPWLSMGGRAHAIFTSHEVAMYWVKMMRQQNNNRKRKRKK